jgi:hypothetical protein
MSIMQPHSWCHVGDDNLTRVMLRSVNKDLVAHYGPAKEAMATLTPAQQILAELPRDAAP